MISVCPYHSDWCVSLPQWLMCVLTTMIDVCPHYIIDLFIMIDVCPHMNNYCVLIIITVVCPNCNDWCVAMSISHSFFHLARVRAPLSTRRTLLKSDSLSKKTRSHKVQYFVFSTYRQLYYCDILCIYLGNTPKLRWANISLTCSMSVTSGGDSSQLVSFQSIVSPMHHIFNSFYHVLLMIFRLATMIVCCWYNNKFSCCFMSHLPCSTVPVDWCSWFMLATYILLETSLA